MILHDLRLAGTNDIKSIRIEQGKIKAIAERKELENISGEIHIELNNEIIFPGFINSHDHLDFNLFPSSGNRTYNNYMEWAKDVQPGDNTIIQRILKLPLELRVQWGMYKNLLNGFTTVVNHGKRLVTHSDMIDVFQDCYSLHSIAFEKNWRRWLINPFKNDKPVVMHIGEGTDEEAKKEIDMIIQWNKLKKKVIAVHGVAMDERHASAFAGLVWCPASNYFLLGKTANIKELKTKVPVLFGTDSTLSSSWNIWEHFRLAKESGELTTEELLQSLTTTPAKVWNLAGHGELKNDAVADIVVIRNKAGDPFIANGPEDILLVMTKGKIRLFDSSLSDNLQKQGLSLKNFSKIYFQDKGKFVEGDIVGLMNEIRACPDIVSFPFTVGS